MSFINYDAPAHEVDDFGSEYSRLQWTNGDLGKSGVLAEGGFEIPLDNIDSIFEDIGWNVYDVPHGSENKQAYLASALNLCVVTYSQWYEKWQDGKLIDRIKADFKTKKPDAYDYRIYAICYIYELEEVANWPWSPFRLSLGGTVAAEFMNLLKAFRNEVIGPAQRAYNANKETKTKIPLYWFWMAVTTSGRERRTSRDNISYSVAPPVKLWNDKLTVEDIESIAVDQNLVKHIEAEVYSQAKASFDDMEMDSDVSTNGHKVPEVIDLSSFWEVVDKNGIDRSVALQAMIKADGDPAEALKLLPMTEAGAINAMNNTTSVDDNGDDDNNDDESEEKAF